MAPDLIIYFIFYIINLPYIQKIFIISLDNLWRKMWEIGEVQNET